MRNSSGLAVAMLCLLSTALAPAARGQHAGHEIAPSTTTPATVPLYRGLGEESFPITTFRADAQSYFDQGWRWMQAFNLEEAEAAFREALRRDPSCAMCSWGVAFLPRAAHQPAGAARADGGRRRRGARGGSARG